MVVKQLSGPSCHLTVDWCRDGVFLACRVSILALPVLLSWSQWVYWMFFLVNAWNKVCGSHKHMIFSSFIQWHKYISNTHLWLYFILVLKRSVAKKRLNGTALNVITPNKKLIYLLTRFQNLVMFINALLQTVILSGIFLKSCQKLSGHSEIMRLRSSFFFIAYITFTSDKERTKHVRIKHLLVKELISCNNIKADGKIQPLFCQGWC